MGLVHDSGSRAMTVDPPATRSPTFTRTVAVRVNILRSRAEANHSKALALFNSSPTCAHPTIQAGDGAGYGAPQCHADFGRPRSSTTFSEHSATRIEEKPCGVDGRSRDRQSARGWCTSKPMENSDTLRSALRLSGSSPTAPFPRLRPPRPDQPARPVPDPGRMPSVEKQRQKDKESHGSDRTPRRPAPSAKSTGLKEGLNRIWPLVSNFKRVRSRRELRHLATLRKHNLMGSAAPEPPTGSGN